MCVLRLNFDDDEIFFFFSFSFWCAQIEVDSDEIFNPLGTPLGPDVSSYYVLLCVLVLIYVWRLILLYLYVLILIYIYIYSHTSIWMCADTSIHVCPLVHVCVLCVPFKPLGRSFGICVLILLYLCAPLLVCSSTCVLLYLCAPLLECSSAWVLLCLCAQTTTPLSSYYNMFPHTTIYVLILLHICVLILLHIFVLTLLYMCPHTIYLSWY
jgi:hypothetical protein